MRWPRLLQVRFRVLCKAIAELSIAAAFGFIMVPIVLGLFAFAIDFVIYSVFYPYQIIVGGWLKKLYHYIFLRNSISVDYEFYWPHYEWDYLIFVALSVVCFITAAKSSGITDVKSIERRYTIYRISSLLKLNAEKHRNRLEDALMNYRFRVGALLGTSMIITINLALAIYIFNDNVCWGRNGTGALQIFTDCDSATELNCLLFMLDLFARGALFDLFEFFGIHISALKSNPNAMVFKALCYVYKIGISGIVILAITQTVALAKITRRFSNHASRESGG
jgi:hypothetical protein